MAETKKTRRPVTKRRRTITKTKKDEAYTQIADLLLSRLTDNQIVKTSQAAAATVQNLLASSDAVKMPKNTKEWLALYTKHVWSYAGVYAIANTIAQLDIQLFKRNKKTKEITEVADHAALDTLRRPNPTMTGYDLMEGTVIFLECVGNAYWEAVKDKQETIVGKKPLTEKISIGELFLLRPDYVKIKPDKTGRGIKEYVFQIPGSPAKPLHFKPDEIVPFKYFNPVNDWLGLGALQVAVDDIRQDKQMAHWNLDFFQHGLAAEGIISVKGQLNNKQMADLAAQLKTFLRGKGRKIPIFSTEDGITFQQLSNSPKDIEFLEGRKENRQAILAALGVPPVMVGLLEHAKYDNFFLQIESFHKETIQPKLRKIESVFVRNYLPMFSDIVNDEENEYFLLFDTTELLQEDKDKLTDRIVKQLEHGLTTPNEGRAKLGMDKYPEGVAGGNLFYMKTTLQPVGELSDLDMEEREDQIAQRLDSIDEVIGEEVERRVSELRLELDAKD